MRACVRARGEHAVVSAHAQAGVYVSVHRRETAKKKAKGTDRNFLISLPVFCHYTTERDSTEIVSYDLFMFVKIFIIYCRY